MALSRDSAARARQLANLQAPPEHVCAKPDNRRSVTHGARASDVEEKSAELVAPIFAANPHLDPVRNGPAVARDAVLLTRIDRVHRWLDEQADPVFKNVRAGKTHGVYERLEKWERSASAEEDRLAISPLTRARLGLDTAKAFDLAAHWAQEGDDDA